MRLALESLAPLDVNGKAAIFIPDATHRPASIYLVFQLDAFALRRSHIRSKGEQQLAGNALLNGQLCTGVLLLAADRGIDRKMRKSRQPLHVAADLAAQTFGEDGLGSQAGLVAATGFGNLPESEQIDDIHRGEGRIRTIRSSQILYGPDDG